MTWLTIPLDDACNRDEFSCGNDRLDFYLKRQVSQDIKRKLTACFVLPGMDNRLVGYYTLSNDIIPAEQLPELFRKKMPRSYSNLPATLLGRLAVDDRFKGRGYGRLLLIDALRRSSAASSAVGSMAVVVDPISQDAVAFYAGFGFINLPDSGRMFMPMKTITGIIPR
ncbi:MAG: GNAT family N-acetyltransferase [Bacteroidota bacterium]